MQEAANETVTELKEARIVSPKERSTTVELDCPVEFDGKVWERIEVHRVTGREVEAYIQKITMLSETDARPPFPVIDCPNEVYEALDDDDRLRLEEAALPFLPRRLTQAAESIRQITEAVSEQ
jgi:hypothetical protein